MVFHPDGAPVVLHPHAMFQQDWRLAAYDNSEKSPELDCKDDVDPAAKNAFFRESLDCCASGPCALAHKELRLAQVGYLLVGKAPGRLQKPSPPCSNSLLQQLPRPKCDLLRRRNT